MLLTADSGVGGQDWFVGRSRELCLLDAQLQQVRIGAPRVVLIEGSPGIGKTSLLRRFLASATDLAVLRASGDEAEVRLPHGVVAQLMQNTDGIAGHVRGPDAAPTGAEDPLVV